ncbi:MAG: J domain-containing protein [Spirochaetaceae bacterium]|nr:J domain-containing protein [Spirochaetaceae bacterium]
MGIFNRLGDVLRSYLNESNDWKDSSSSYSRARYYSGDPDVAEAFDELDDFLNGKDSPYTKQDAFSDLGGKTADWSSPRSGKQAKPAIPEALRVDFAELGLKFGASEEECKAAHKRLMKIHHPDRHILHEGNMKKATEKSARINASYERICKWRKTGSV